MNIQIKTVMLIVLLAFPFAAEKKMNTSQEKNALTALKLSIVPGLGQFYNKKYLKGTLFLSSEVYLLSLVKHYYNIDINKRNLYMWISLLVYTVNIIDAYIDSELDTFTNLEEYENRSNF
ncbi:MAG: hypothetical protein CMG00_01490 [Candidatus Marinimicrobia bacterium]|nr:hypothetical protein [Candidatus Neomarinimicrobiota bacterium]|tara:strand:- start:3226 stop:3585 length:360 start_codon:yes stop_codon:yes gene_type:complete